jgi:hypothetical protein
MFDMPKASEMSLTMYPSNLEKQGLYQSIIGKKKRRIESLDKAEQLSGMINSKKLIKS